MGLRRWKRFFKSREFAQLVASACVGAVVALITGTIALYGTLQRTAVEGERTDVERRAVAVEEDRQERQETLYYQDLNDELRSELEACRRAQQVWQEERLGISVQQRVLQIENRELRERMDELERIVRQNE